MSIVPSATHYCSINNLCGYRKQNSEDWRLEICLQLFRYLTYFPDIMNIDVLRCLQKLTLMIILPVIKHIEPSKTLWNELPDNSWWKKWRVHIFLDVIHGHISPVVRPLSLEGPGNFWTLHEVHFMKCVGDSPLWCRALLHRGTSDPTAGCASNGASVLRWRYMRIPW